MSAPAADAESAEAAARREQIIRTLTLSMFLNVTSACTPIQAEVELFNTVLFPGQVARASAALAAVSSAGGALEFTFNPTLGRLSDSAGRRPFFLIPCSVAAASNMMTVLIGNASPKATLAFSVLRKVMATWGGSVATMTLLGDVASGREYGIAFARVFGAAGYGVIAGPLIGTAILRRTRSFRAVYATAALISAIQIANNFVSIPETLDAAKRRPFAGLVNPFAFLKVFGVHGAMTKMVLAAAMPSFAEGKNLHDIQMRWMLHDAKLSTETIGTYITAWGAFCLLGAMRLAPLLIRRLGTRAFTTITNTTNAASYALMSLLPRMKNPIPALYAALVLLTPGINGTNSAATKGWATSYALKAGLGSGEYAGYFGNARALTTMLSPLMYGRMYQACEQRGISRAPVWLLATILGCILPELLWRSIPARQMPDAGQKSQ